jgi:hypothetical protein
VASPPIGYRMQMHRMTRGCTDPGAFLYAGSTQITSTAKEDER